MTDDRCPPTSPSICCRLRVIARHRQLPRSGVVVCAWGHACACPCPYGVARPRPAPRSLTQGPPYPRSCRIKPAPAATPRPAPASLSSLCARTSAPSACQLRCDLCRIKIGVCGQCLGSMPSHSCRNAHDLGHDPPATRFSAESSLAPAATASPRAGRSRTCPAAHEPGHQIPPPPRRSLPIQALAPPPLLPAPPLRRCRPARPRTDLHHPAAVRRYDLRRFKISLRRHHSHAPPAWPLAPARV